MIHFYEFTLKRNQRTKVMHKRSSPGLLKSYSLVMKYCLFKSCFRASFWIKRMTGFQEKHTTESTLITLSAFHIVSTFFLALEWHQLLCKSYVWYVPVHVHSKIPFVSTLSMKNCVEVILALKIFKHFMRFIFRHGRCLKKNYIIK